MLQTTCCRVINPRCPTAACDHKHVSVILDNHKAYVCNLIPIGLVAVQDGNTSLHIAAGIGNRGMAAMLLDKGARPGPANNVGGWNRGNTRTLASRTSAPGIGLLKNAPTSHFVCTTGGCHTFLAEEKLVSCSPSLMTCTSQLSTRMSCTTVQCATAMPRHNVLLRGSEPFLKATLD
jgi:ankyrin repeat protein